MLGWGLQPDWGEYFLLSEGVEQSGEQASFVFPCGAVTALATAQSRIEQIPEGVTEQVERVDDKRQAKSKPERQALAPSPCIDVPPGRASRPSWAPRGADRIRGNSVLPLT